MMSFCRTANVAAVLGLGVALGLGGCGTMLTGRDRIVRTAPRCTDQTVQIYFEPESAEVTKEGRAVLRAAASQSKSCRLDGVDVLGLSDSTGAPDANLDLSKRRAQSVTAALTAAGLPGAEFKLSAAGQADAVTPEGRTRPLRRRADVVLHLSPS